MPRARWAIAAAWAAVIWLSSPTLPLLRARLAATGGFRSLVLALLVAASALAAIVALRRIGGGPRRLARGLALAALTAGLVLVARLLAAPDPRSRLVELMHFVEFGTLAALAFEALGPSRRVSERVVWTLLVVLGVGLADETLQHLLASRFAEVRDVLLNVAAGGFGVGYALVLDPPLRDARPGDLRFALLAGLGLVLAVGLFVDRVHRAHWVRFQGVELRSSYTERDLLEAGRERAERWRAIGPDEAALLLRPDASFLALADRFATEARFHVQARNEAADRGDLRGAAFENAILERYFGAFLDATGSRRRDLPTRPSGTYRSPALAHLWADVTAGQLWSGVALLAGAFGGAILWLRKAESS